MNEFIAYIGMGSNLGDRMFYLSEAIRLLEAHPSIKFVSISHFYETEPLTLREEKQNWYLNGVMKIKTTLNPVRLLHLLQEIENQLGRERSEKWAPRTIDLDLLFFEDEIIRSKTLTLPHPELHLRRFVLEPLAEIAPSLIHPVKGISIRHLLKNLQSNKKVTPLYRFQIRHSSTGMLKSPLRERL